MVNNKAITFFCFLVLMIFAIHSNAIIQENEIPVKKAIKQQKNPYANATISFKIIPSVKKTFGYDILLNGKTLVHQPNIPGLPGNEGFTTKARAQKVAAFVIKKIRNNEMPPTVTMDDLNKMGVLK